MSARACRLLRASALFLAVAFVARVHPSAAVVQNPSQRKCIVKLNQAAARVAKAQGVTSRACLAAFAAGRPEDVGSPASAQLCLDADPFGKGARAGEKTLAAEARSCAGPLPEFGYTGGVNVNLVARNEARSLVVELLGDLDDAVAAAGTSPEAARCQAQVLAAALKVHDKTWAAVLRAKKRALPGATSGPELAQALATEVGAQPKLAALRAGLASGVAEACAGLALDPLFLALGCGPLDTVSPEAFGACAAARGSCAVGFALFQVDAFGLALDVDLLDDGVSNDSCLTN